MADVKEFKLHKTNGPEYQVPDWVEAAFKAALIAFATAIAEGLTAWAREQKR